MKKQYYLLGEALAYGNFLKSRRERAKKIKKLENDINSKNRYLAKLLQKKLPQMDINLKGTKNQARGRKRIIKDDEKMFQMFLEIKSWHEDVITHLKEKLSDNNFKKLFRHLRKLSPIKDFLDINKINSAGLERKQGQYMKVNPYRDRTDFALHFVAQQMGPNGPSIPTIKKTIENSERKRLSELKKLKLKGLLELEKSRRKRRKI